MADDPAGLLFEALTPLGFRVRVTRAYWDLIVTIKHPAMVEREADVRRTLQNPDSVRQSRSDPAVHLFYRFDRPQRWVCAVTKRLNGEGFLITAYPTLEPAKEAVRLGACDYLAKPVPPDEVIQATRGAVMEKRWALRKDGSAQEFEEKRRAGASAGPRGTQGVPVACN